jgi:flagellar M-ring protein FliF
MDFKTLVSQITDLFVKLNKKQKTIIALSTLAAIGFIVFLVLYTNSKSDDSGYSTLFDNLTASDTALVIKQLEADNIPYKIVNESTIKVPKDSVYKERIAIAAQGIPKSSKIGFELFDKQNFGETDFAQNIKYLRALEGELAKTIQALTPIEDAKVHIALPKESLFVEKETPPTASIVLHIKKSYRLDPSQIKGIKNLVSASIPKLSPENVKLIDQEGEPLEEGIEDGFSPREVQAQVEYKKRFEKALERKIEKILSPILGGKGHLVAKVTAEFDFKQKKIVDEYYDPESVVRSEQSTEEKREGKSGNDTAGGVPGAISNISPTKPIDENKNSATQKYEKSTTTTNYEISKKITNIKGEFATLKRVTAAVVVDGKYEEDPQKKGEKIYKKLDEKELKSIETIVKRAIGFDKKRGDEVAITNMPFKEKIDKSKTQNISQKAANYINPLLPVLKFLIAGMLLFIFYKKVISPFSQKMIQDYKAEEEEDIIEDEEIVSESDDNEALEKYNEAKRKIEEELGVHEDMDEETLRHNILLDKIRSDINETPEELAKLIEMILKDSKGI